MFRFTFTFLFLLIAFPANSQTRISDAELLFQSRHIWRGSQLGKAFAVEPSITLTNNRFSFNFWAAVTPDNSYSEVDLVPTYLINNLKITLFDYYNPIPGEINQYLNFKEGKCRHSLELTLDNFSVDKPGLKWMIGTFLAGDRNKETGKSLYSTYIEFRYPITIWAIDAEPFAGLTPFQGYYADRFALINAGISLSKELDLKLPFKFPLSLSYISNPYSRKNFIIIGVGIAI
jgi:hypothetical protein